LVKIQENSNESRISLANFYARISRSDEAVKILTEIISENPEYARARYRLGEIYLDRQENTKAAEQIEALLQINDKDSEALLLRARLLLGENKSEEAIKDLEEILKRQPSHRDALFLMTQARLALGQTDQARAFIGDLDRFHPNYLKTRLLKIQTAFTVGDALSAFRQANELYEIANGTVADAITMAQEIAELRFRALSARGLANLELGKLAEAKADLQEVQKNSPKSSAALVNLAKVFMAEKNWTESLGLYEKALALDNRNFDALSGIISVLNRQKRFSEAHAKIDEALRANAGQNNILPSFHYLKADIFLAERNPQAAEAELKKAIELDENYLPAYSAYASILVARNQTAEAIEQYKKAVEKKPSATLYTLIGMLEESSENFAEAEKNYRKALELSPGLAIAANNLAWLIADQEQGNLDEALTLAQGAVNQNSNVAAYYDTLGWVYFKKGLYLPAAEQLRKAIAIDETETKRTGRQANASYRLRLGVVLASSGDKFAARKEIETSLKSEKNMSPKEVQEAKNLLATL
jgi:tetratricopeptide (TPR) repeat protein